jgi:hypothetical protein
VKVAALCNSELREANVLEAVAEEAGGSALINAIVASKLYNAILLSPAGRLVLALLANDIISASTLAKLELLYAL